MPKPLDDELLRSGQLAKLLYVTSKTITRYATENGLPFVQTPGGHRRYRKSQALAWYAEFLKKSLAKNQRAGAMQQPGWRQPNDAPGPEQFMHPPSRSAPAQGHLDGAGRT
jgi:excisionase family DNA binding protein